MQNSSNWTRKRKNIDIKDTQKKEQFQTDSQTMSPRDGVKSPKLVSNSKLKEAQVEQAQKQQQEEALTEGKENTTQHHTTIATGHFTDGNNSKYLEDRTTTQLIQTDQKSDQT